jgi:hypothetical protein|tara:strand:- start:465 stop:716 length:252 start_codon:yes stop_codon:yes gene_type:complete
MKLSKEELQSINDLQLQSDQIKFSFGDLKIQELNLLDQLKSVITEQNTLGEILNAKYGNGRIDLSTGEVTPLDEEKPTTPITP